MKEGYLDDTILIEKFQRGDKGAFDRLVQRHQNRAYQYAFRLTRNPEEAADVVAEAFVRVYKAIDSFKGQSAFTTWLYRILTNCFLDIRKKERSRPAVSLEATLYTPEGEMERQVEDQSRSPYDQTETSERERCMCKAVEVLPEYQKAMIVMYHSEMMSYDEIARTLDLPIGTVKSRLNRARISLRDLLGREDELFAVA
jgi:RNA polymerase sigma-70 factor, ECF subfamily